MHDATAIDPATTPEASGKRTAHLAPALRLLCGLGGCLGPGPGVSRSSVLAGVGGRTGGSSWEVAWESGTSA